MQKRSWIIWGLLFVGLTLLGLSFSVNDYVFRDMLRDYYRSLDSFWSMLSWDLVYWPTWALLAPLIYLLARRFPLGRDNWPRNLLLSLVAGFILTIVHRVIYYSIIWLIQTAMGEQLPFLKPALLLYNLPTGLMTY